MGGDYITQRQVSFVLIMFVFGSTLVFGIGIETKQDAWISALFTLAMITPTVIVYARIMSLFPGNNLFEIAKNLFGKTLGTIINILMSGYALQLGSAVLRNFTDFIQVSTMPETPQLAVGLLMIICVIYLTKSGVTTFGKWAVLTCVIICLVIMVTFSASLRLIEVKNYLPVMNHSYKELLTASYKQFALPFAETVLFLGIADSLKKGDSPYRAYLQGILVAGCLSVLILLRNIGLLGPAMMDATYFPSFNAAKIMNLGDFLPRIESLITTNYLFAGITKIALCLLAASKGIANLFDLQDYREILAPAGMMILALSVISYESVMHLFEFVDRYYAIYAIPFQIIIPLAIWIAAEIKVRRKKSRAGASIV